MNRTLYFCRVERNDRDKEFYLLRKLEVDYTPSYTLFLMRKDHSIRELRPGDVVLATSTGKKIGKYEVLSQKIPEHILNIVKLYTIEELKRIPLFLDRVATLRKAKICKIGVWGKKTAELGFYELNKLLSTRIRDVLSHIPDPIFIPAEEELILPSAETPWYEVTLPAKFVLNALYPADVSKVIDFQYDSELRKAYVVVREKDLPLFLWKDYINAKLASKLTKVSYHFIISETGKEIIVDVYNVEQFMKKLLSGEPLIKDFDIIDINSEQKI